MINSISPLAGFASAPASVSPSVGTASQGADFARQLSDIVNSAEKAAIGGVEGTVPVYQAVEQVLQAERTLSATVAIRDKIVSAYLELSRMQI
jgi:flagellar hook-basal body complex protein FliE